MSTRIFPTIDPVAYRTYVPVAIGSLIVACVAALVAIFAVSIASTQQTTASVQDYTAAVRADNGVVGKHVQAQAAKALSDAGALAAAQRFSIATKVLTDATTGTPGARQKLAKDIAAANVKLDESQKAVTQSSTASAAVTREYDANWKALKTLTDAYAANKTSINDGIKASSDIASATGLSTISTKAQL